jgi:hypothetical protein
MRVISMPESLNAETGCACSYLGDSRQFRRLSVDEILRRAKSAKASIGKIQEAEFLLVKIQQMDQQYL